MKAKIERIIERVVLSIGVFTACKWVIILVENGIIGDLLPYLLISVMVYNSIRKAVEVKRLQKETDNLLKQLKQTSK